MNQSSDKYPATTIFLAVAGYAFTWGIAPDYVVKGFQPYRLLPPITGKPEGLKY